MTHALLTALNTACYIYDELPSVVTSTVSGTGVRFFNTASPLGAVSDCSFQEDTSNVIIVRPRLLSGARVAYVIPEDVCWEVTNVDADSVSVHGQTRLNANGDIALWYMPDDGAEPVPKKLRVCVRVCGVLLVDACVHRAFSGRASGRSHSCHTHAINTNTSSFFFLEQFYGGMAIHPTGTHLVVSYQCYDFLRVFALPGLQQVSVLGTSGAGSMELKRPRGLCFTETGTLLVSDHNNARVQHWTLEGSWIASYPVQKPQCVASRGNLLATGSLGTSSVSVFLLESGIALFKWLTREITVTVLAFVDATTLAVANYTAETIDLCTLDGTLKRQIAVGIWSFAFEVSTDNCLLVEDYSKERIRVFTLEDGALIGTSCIARQIFEGHPCAIALHAENAYVLQIIARNGNAKFCINVFE